MSDLLARAALTRLVEPGDADLGERLDGLGAPVVLEQIRRGTLASQRLEQYRARLSGLDVQADLAAAGRVGGRLVVPGSEEWPATLDDLGAARPIALWVRGGGQLGEMGRRAVAVVGARACTAYGERIAGELGAGLSERGWTVVSGGAFGIDAAAHRGALAMDAGTVAVLACGVDIAYPAGHDTLLARVRDAGAVVTELPPGARPTKGRFLKRNRVIAALARGTVVVEAAVRSGALNTASHAAELSRPVMAVPGPVTSVMSAGCHELVRTRGSSLVTDTADVLDLVGSLGADDSPPRRGERRPHDGLDELHLRVLDALPVRRPASPESAARVAGLDLPTVVRVLGLLAALGLAEGNQGGWRKAPAPRAGA